MAHIYGPAKSLDEITLDDVLSYPVWVWIWQTGEELGFGQDETWQQPVLGVTNVNASFSEAIIGFRVKGTELYGSGSYSPSKDQLFGMALWIDDAWKLLSRAGVKAPLTLVAIAKINGKPSVEFICSDLQEDVAIRKP